MRLADGVLLVVDAAEGTMVVTEKVVKQALAEGLPITLLLTKARLCMRPAPHSHRFLRGAWGRTHQGCNMHRARRVFFFFFSPPSAFGTWAPLRRVRARSLDEHNTCMPCHQVAQHLTGHAAWPLTMPRSARTGSFVISKQPSRCVPHAPVARAPRQGCAIAPRNPKTRVCTRQHWRHPYRGGPWGLTSCEK